MKTPVARQTSTCMYKYRVLVHNKGKAKVFTEQY